MNIRISRPNSHQHYRVRPRRVEALAVLPVFLNLKGRKALIAGGSNAAAWKAELLVAAGANVHLYAERIGKALETLALSEPGAGSFHWHCLSWRKADFSGAAVAVADAENVEEAKAFFETANTCSVPVNVIDRPDFCTFQFGSIVNRSPVIVGISTNGAAPILGQAIRRRIEALLPPGLADWTRLAKSIRSEINSRLKAGGERRVFWEKFVDRAFEGLPETNARGELLNECGEISRAMKPVRGQITFVGVRSADAEMLTLKAVRIFQSADVIFHDRFVTDEMLELARREAKRIRIGVGNAVKSPDFSEVANQIRILAIAGHQIVCLGNARSSLLMQLSANRSDYEASGIQVSVHLDF